MLDTRQPDPETSALELSGPMLMELMQAVLEKGLPFRFQAKGCSMSPFIRDGDTIVMIPLQHGGPCVGDVVAARHPVSRELVIHRLVAGRRNRLLLKGDNNAEHDGFIRTEDILAKVSKTERAGRPVFWGGGPERRLIAFLSRKCLLTRLVSLVRHIRRT